MSKTFKTLLPLAYPHGDLPYLQAADVPDTTLMRTLYAAVTKRRASGSRTEAQFVAWLANRVAVTLIDEAGNLHVDTRQGPQHRTMFTSHTDTVHHQGGPNNVRLDATNPKQVLWRADKDACLGADDGAGIALMMHMLEAGVPGYYVFFRGEEVGGVGSRWLARNMAPLLHDIDRCVSFDRAGYADVITHQAGGRCCSDAFADALADSLTTSVDWFMADSSGVFTDSANLTHFIAECTNVSVGYADQHGDDEYQDITFLQRLATALVTVQWDDLPVRRDPKVREALWGQVSPLGLAGDDASGDARLIDALYQATNGDCKALTDIVAEHIDPLNAHDARPHLSTRKLNYEVLAAYALGLECGDEDADAVLTVLAEDMYAV